jgi:hypothetical protein
VIALIPISGSSFKILRVIRSCPGAFFGGNGFIEDLASVSLNFLPGVSSWSGFQGHERFPVILLLTSQNYMV